MFSLVVVAVRPTNMRKRKENRLLPSRQVRIQVPQLYGKMCLLCPSEGPSQLAHVNDIPNQRHFLDFVPLCATCNSNMENCGASWQTVKGFSPNALSDRAERYYAEGRYLRSVACYRLLAWLMARDKHGAECAAKEIALAFRPARNFGWFAFPTPVSEDDDLLHDPAQIILCLLRELRLFLSQLSTVSLEVHAEIRKACEIALFECPSEAGRTIELSEAARQNWYKDLYVRARDDRDFAQLGQWLMYAAIFRALKEGTYSSAANRDFEQAVELWSHNHERLANAAAIGLQFASLQNNRDGFRMHWKRFSEHRRSASEINRHTAVLVRTEMELRRGKTRQARQTLDGIVSAYVDERIPTTVYIPGFPMHVPNAARVLDEMANDRHLRISYSHHIPVSAAYEPKIVEAIEDMLGKLGGS